VGDPDSNLEALIQKAPKSVRGLYRARVRGVEKRRKDGQATTGEEAQGWASDHED